MKALFFDIDGTLLSEITKEIPQSALDALKKTAEKGNLTLPKLKDLKKSLVKDAFFVKQNKVILSGQDAITNSEALEQHISNIETKIQQTPAYKAIENLLNDSKGIVLKDIIETIIYWDFIYYYNVLGVKG